MKSNSFIQFFDKGKRSLNNVIKIELFEPNSGIRESNKCRYGQQTLTPDLIILLEKNYLILNRFNSHVYKCHAVTFKKLAHKCVSESFEEENIFLGTSIKISLFNFFI